MDSHIKARDIWALKIEHPDLYSHVDKDNYYYQKLLRIYPPAEQLAIAASSNSNSAESPSDATKNVDEINSNSLSTVRPNSKVG